jgi:hypothetical protein
VWAAVGGLDSVESSGCMEWRQAQREVEGGGVMQVCSASSAFSWNGDERTGEEFTGDTPTSSGGCYG